MSLDSPTDGGSTANERLHVNDRTVSITFGTNWAGIWWDGYPLCWRVSLGFVAVTFYKGDFGDLLRAWLA